MLRDTVICITLFGLHIINVSQSVTQQNYGKFKLRLTDMKVCRGPKQTDCNDMTVKLENGTNLLIYQHVKEDVIPTRGKVEAMVNNTPTLRLQMKKPCDHLFMKPLFQKIMNVTQNCEFKKGDYILNIDIEDVAQRYYGGMFLYGTYTFKAVFYNDKCNFSCVILEVQFSPKNSPS